MQEEAVIYRGERIDAAYGDFQEEMNMFNRAFAEVMLEGDGSGQILSFPIPTYNITRDFDWNNPAYENIWKMAGKYGIPYFTNYVNSDLDPDDARSMCPLPGYTPVIVRRINGESRLGQSANSVQIRTMKSVVDSMKQHPHLQWQTFYNGEWSNISGAQYSFDKTKTISLKNGLVIELGLRHLQPILRDGLELTVPADQIVVGDMLPFNRTAINGFENEGTYDFGFVIGAYLGDGSADEYATTFSLCATKNNKGVVGEKIINFFAALGITSSTSAEGSVYVHSPVARQIIGRYVSGDYAKTKAMTANVFRASPEFRQGIIDGLMATDGSAHNKQRIYTSSEALRDDIVRLYTSLGYITSVYVDEGREDRLGGADSVIYAIKPVTRTNYGDFYRTTNGTMYVGVSAIEESISAQDLYCFEVDNESRLFTLANGLITHNCRLRLRLDELRRRGGGLFGSGSLTGSVGVVTINMPRLGYLSKTKEEFYQELDHLMDLARDSLVSKRMHVEELTDLGMFPYCRNYLSAIKGRLGGYWKNHFSTIGLLGMHECCINMGMGGIQTEEGRAFAMEVLLYMRERLTQYQIETGDMFNLEATPAEGVSYRMFKEDASRYHMEGVGDHYTNSTHLPVDHTSDLFAALDHQSELQELYTGGSVLHGFIGSEIEDPEKVKWIIRTAFNNYKLPYLSITPTFSTCTEHGYIAGEHAECPHCGKETLIYSRVVGFYRPVSAYNVGKKKEFSHRKTYDASDENLAHSHERFDHMSMAAE